MVNELVFGATTYDDSDLYGGVDYERVVNTDHNLMVGAVCAASIKFKMKSNPFQIGDQLTYSINGGTIGVFNITDIVKGKTDYTYTALDNVSKFDADSTDWTTSLGRPTFTTPMTLTDLLEDACQYLGLTVDVSTAGQFDNYDYIEYTNYLDEGISFRQIIGYIAQIAGAYCYANGSGEIAFGYIHNSGGVQKTFTPANYKQIEVADYTVAAVDKVWLGMGDDDIGITYPTGGIVSGDNVMRLYNNPFLYADTDHPQSDIEAVLQTILSKVAISYRPFKLNGFVVDAPILYDIPIKYTGAAPISVNGEIMTPFSVKWSKSGIELEATGDKDRTEVQVVSLAEQRMKGSYNSLKRDVDETQSIIGNAMGQISEVSQTVEGVRIELTSAINEVEDELNGPNGHATVQRQFIQYGSDGLTLGKEGATTKARLTNERLAFLDGTGDEKAYIGYVVAEDTYKFFVVNGHIVNNLEFGDDWNVIVRTSNLPGHTKKHLTFKGRT